MMHTKEKMNIDWNNLDKIYPYYSKGEYRWDSFPAGEIVWAWCKRASTSSSEFGKITNKNHGFVICKCEVQDGKERPYLTILKVYSDKWRKRMQNEKIAQGLFPVGFGAIIKPV